MAFQIKPQIRILIDFEGSKVNKGLMSRWLREQGIEPESCDGWGEGWTLVFDIPDAEKVVEWLKAHGVEPCK